MMKNQDLLYDYLPAIYRTRDAEQGYPLRALLRVISEQVNLVEADIDQLYENWFIETAEDWVVPYIGDLIGYELVHEAGQPGGVTTDQDRQRNKILIPRREVANTIRYRRRKGTLSVLEQLARDIADWPARAVEFYKLLAWNQHVNHIRPARTSVDLRHELPLHNIDGPFDSVMHTIDVRRPNSQRTNGRYNIPDVGLFVWRLKPYSVTQTPAYCLEAGGAFYTFSALGNDAPLFTKPIPEPESTHIAGPLHVPEPIGRYAFKANKEAYYGPNKSLQIWVETDADGNRRPISYREIVVADLTNWAYRPQGEQVAVDPELGRIVFPRRRAPKYDVLVSYHYGFSADMGGGEYQRLDQTLTPPDYVVRRLTSEGTVQAASDQVFDSIYAALEKWRQDQPEQAVIEIADSQIYMEPFPRIELAENQSLQIRAANKKRPIIWVSDRLPSRPDALLFSGETGSRLHLNGLLIAGRGIQVEGSVATLDIQHCTIVPGWTLGNDCEPQRPLEPSLELIYTPDICVNISHSILGTIQVTQDEVKSDPIPITITDSILDAAADNCDDPGCEAFGAPGWPLAHTALTIKRSTVFGRLFSHAILLAENSIFMGEVKVGRRQIGCMRFCYIPPGSRTPRRYNCQPDMVVKAAMSDGPEAVVREKLRVRPQFMSTRYGTPVYAQLALTCASEITSGASDESEMGAFHDLFQPQRAANLQTRLEEYTPAGMDASLIYVS